jgi:hypothetical protein
MSCNRLRSLSVLAFGILLPLGGAVRGDDAQDTKDIVGTWKADYTAGYLTAVFTADGKYKDVDGWNHEWRISNGKLITTHSFLGTKRVDFILNRNTLKIDNGTKDNWSSYTRKQ